MSFTSASAPGAPAPPLDPGHAYARTSYIAFTFHKQQASPAPFGYEYFLSLPPGYEAQPDRKWPLLLFLHGAGESQRARGESYASIRHGVPKISASSEWRHSEPRLTMHRIAVLCYDKLKAGEPAPTHIEIPRPPRGKRWRQDPSDLSPSPVPAAVCERVAESCITLSPSLDVTHGYGWNPRVLGALLDEIVRAHRVDADAVHVTGFSMGGYGTWALALATPNRFASVVPICGGGEVALAKNIKHLPHWCVIVLVAGPMHPLNSRFRLVGCITASWTTLSRSRSRRKWFARSNAQVRQWSSSLAIPSLRMTRGRRRTDSWSCGTGCLRSVGHRVSQARRSSSARTTSLMCQASNYVIQLRFL
jgi:pimeloyl-ACP methyl ester carboxylesterase